ncbi:MAG: hypothetical protein LBP56_04930 [Odoribacteraceae bacterium]|jgi:hypothetical protein|nr:hypothetical protein [Odoribacteraceae bacterium]
MKTNTLFILFITVFLASCRNEDLGNYDYHEIIEMTIDPLADSYSVMMDIGILEITPRVTLSDGSDPDNPRFEYFWITDKSLGRHDTIGRSRVLHWQAMLPIDAYDLRLRVFDRETGLLWKHETKLNVTSYHGRGILLIGENGQGNVRVQLLGMIQGQDTVLYPDLFAYSDLPDLTGPIDVFHTGNSSTTMGDTRRIWLTTASGSYWIDRYTLRSSINNTLNTYMPTPRVPPLGIVALAPRIKQANGDTGANGQRFIITSDGNLYGCYIGIYGSLYEFPVNCLANDLFTYFPVAPYLFYSLNSMNGVVWYDTLDERFMLVSSALNAYSIALVDNPADPFPWNQAGTGRTLVYGENTRDTEGSSPNGNSFAIMHSDLADSTYIYKFYANGNPPKKRACYPVIASARAAGFDDARFYAFASNRPVVFFVTADNHLYCYDYNPGSESVYPVDTGTSDPITMLKFDREMEPTSDFLYIATYNAATAGGTLTKYALNTMGQATLSPLPDYAKWAGQLAKIVNMSWRGSE